MQLLFSINKKENFKFNENESKRIGLSEFNYSIPLSYKILVSGNIQKIPNTIWKFDGDIALVGEMNLGKKRFFNFLDFLDDFDSPLPNLNQQITKVRAFFRIER